MSRAAGVTAEQNVSRVVQEMMDALNGHDAEKFMSLVTVDYEGIDVNQALPQRGQDEARLALENYFQAFPDLSMVEHEVLIEGNRAAIMWRARGTHLGSIMHIPPSGKQVEVRGTTVLRMNGARICQAVSVWDVAAMLREIGLLPEL